MDRNYLINGNLGFFIDNNWCDVVNNRKFKNINPSNGNVLCFIKDCGPEEIKKSILSSKKAFNKWASLNPKEKSDYLRKIADGIRDNLDLLSEIITLENGKPILESMAEVNHAANIFYYYSEECKRIYGEIVPSNKKNLLQVVVKDPIGIVGIITPWNFPLSMLARKLAPALGAGCCAIVKPATQTPLSAIALFEIIKAINLPPGVANLVCTSKPAVIAKYLTRDKNIRLITFTGSKEVGQFLIRKASRNITKLVLEHGGNAAFVVFKDADIEEAVNGLIISKFRNTGQVCIAPNRIFIHYKIADDFLSLLTTKVSDLKIGNGFKKNVDIGPLINKYIYKKVADHVQDAIKKGACCILGGKRFLTKKMPSNVYFYYPTIIINIKLNMKIFRAETFGPVIPIRIFKDNNKVIDEVNNSKYGLAAYAYTKDLSLALNYIKNVNAGVISINNPKPASPECPFGGMKESGLGREGGWQGLNEFLEIKSASIIY